MSETSVMKISTVIEGPCLWKQRQCSANLRCRLQTIEDGSDTDGRDVNLRYLLSYLFLRLNISIGHFLLVLLFLMSEGGGLLWTLQKCQVSICSVCKFSHVLLSLIVQHCCLFSEVSFPSPQFSSLPIPLFTSLRMLIITGTSSTFNEPIVLYVLGRLE